jgi:uncharacterized protein YcbK (DUF882 family)
MDRRQFLSLLACSAVVPAPARAILTPLVSRRLDLVNAHTGEKFSGPYRNDDGPIVDAMNDLSIFLRDFHSGAVIPIDVGLVDFLANVMDAVGVTGATVLSAYRTPETNEMLARTMFGVAEHSQHIYGRAVDIYLPARLEEAMVAARAMQRGGVGWYPQSGFIHLDSGPVRNWTLDGQGFGHLLLGGPTPWFSEPIIISPNGDLVTRRTGQPANVSDRLALHNLLERALGLPSGR